MEQPEIVILAQDYPGRSVNDLRLSLEVTHQVSVLTMVLSGSAPARSADYRNVSWQVRSGRHHFWLLWASESLELTDLLPEQCALKRRKVAVLGHIVGAQGILGLNWQDALVTPKMESKN